MIEISLWIIIGIIVFVDCVRDIEMHGAKYIIDNGVHIVAEKGKIPNTPE